MPRLKIVAVKLTKQQLAQLDAEVRRRQATEVEATRSSVLRDALAKLVETAPIAKKRRRRVGSASPSIGPASM